MMKKTAFYVILVVLFCSLSLSAQAGIFTVPDWVQKSCVFIMNGDEAEGTGFLVFLEDEGATFCYLVSAKHVIEPILSNPEVSLSVRFNLKESNKAKVVTFSTFKFNGIRWLQHDNPAIDLAVIPLSSFNQLSDLLDVAGVAVKSPSDDFFATSDWLNSYSVAPGDQVFTLGLVPYLYSKDQSNLVLARFGRISLLPKSELDLPGGKQKAYFLDCQAFGGNSGSPAFVLVERTESGAATLASWRFALLGVVTQFVPSPLRSWKVDTQDVNRSKDILYLENTGISKVVPVDYLNDILFSDEQKAFRKKIAESEKERTKNRVSE